MFEGKVIDFYNTDGKFRKVKVIGCVKDLGITLVKENDPNHYCFCMVMNTNKNFSLKKGYITRSRKIFTQVRKMIIEGEVDLRKLNITFEPEIASASTCKFNQ